MQPSQVPAAARLVYSFHNVSNQMDPGRKTQNQNLELFVIVWIFFLPSSCHLCWFNSASRTVDNLGSFWHGNCCRLINIVLKVEYKMCCTLAVPMLCSCWHVNHISTCLTIVLNGFIFFFVQMINVSCVQLEADNDCPPVMLYLFWRGFGEFINAF